MHPFRASRPTVRLLAGSAAAAAVAAVAAVAIVGSVRAGSSTGPGERGAAAAPPGPASRAGAPDAGVEGRVPDAGREGPVAGGRVRVRREVGVMGTRLVVTVDGADRDHALRSAEAALRSVEHLEGVLSTWNPATDLSRANRAPVGTAHEPSGGLASLLARAERLARRTGRAFEPAVGALVDAWDLRGRGRRPDPAALRRARAAAGPRGIRIDPRSGALTRLREEAWIDAGGFGKGAALAAARDTLWAAGVRSAFLDLGGQVLALGTPPGSAPGWTVPVAHPARRDRPVATLRLRSASAATSGASERAVRVDGARLGHVLDPRTGRPVPAWGSVTVVSADPFEADVLATALFVMGADTALAWARSRPGLAVLVLEPRGGAVRARWTLPMERWLVEAPGRARADSVLQAVRSVSGGPISSPPRTERNHP